MNGNEPEKVIIVPYCEEHVAKTVNWVNDPEIMVLVDRSPEEVTLDGCHAWARSIQQDGKKAMFAILYGNGREHIGNCGLFEIDKRSRKAKLWIYIGEKDKWGRGIGKKALNMLLGHGFNVLGLNRVYLYVIEDNTRARRLYESQGFSREGVLREDTFMGGKFKNTVFYSILSKEFKGKDIYGQSE